MIYQFTAEQTDANLNFDIALEKDTRVSCFISENGVGKTNLLENMAKTLIYAHSIFRKKQEHLTYSGMFDKTALHSQLQDLELRLAWDISLNGQRIKDKHRAQWTTTRLEDTFPFVEHIKNPCDDPLVFIGAKDRGYTGNIAKQHVKIVGSTADRFVEAFLRSFDYMSGNAVHEQEIANWFISRTILNPSLVPEYPQRMAEVTTVLELIQRLEPALNDLVVREENTIRVNVVFKEGMLYFDNVPIDKLSTGYVAIIKIFQEIIAGYGGWTGFYGETDLAHVEGVVFIDELESHLHPRWQHTFIPLLKEFFPNATFYVATHSPLIVSTTDQGEAYELLREGNSVTAKQLGNPNAWYLADVFAQGFHVDFSEFPKGSGNGSLADQLQKFSVLVKDYTQHQDGELKQDIEQLYQTILPSLADDDPRRRSLDYLKGLVT